MSDINKLVQESLDYFEEVLTTSILLGASIGSLLSHLNRGDYLERWKRYEGLARLTTGKKSEKYSRLAEKYRIKASHRGAIKGAIHGAVGGAVTGGSMIGGLSRIPSYLIGGAAEHVSKKIGQSKTLKNLRNKFRYTGIR